MAELLREGIPFSNAPGVAYEYSNYRFAILGRIVARASGMSYNDYLDARILRPLGMATTTMERARVPADRLAHGYRWEDERWKVEPPLSDGAFGPMGGMLTSVRDLSRYVGSLLDAWPPRDGAESGPIRRSSLREMQQVARFAGASASRDTSGSLQLTAGGYGYGLRVSQTCTFRHIVAHSGGLPGFGSQMIWLPEYGVGIIVFGNVTYTPWDASCRTPSRDSRGPEVFSPASLSPRLRSWPPATAWPGWCRAGTIDSLPGWLRTTSFATSRASAGGRSSKPSARKSEPARWIAIVSTPSKRAARPVDDDVRARQAAGGDHARADDAAEGAVPLGPAGAGGRCRQRAARSSANRDLPLRRKPRISRRTVEPSGPSKVFCGVSGGTFLHDRERC